jgi:hypothetical protein
MWSGCLRLAPCSDLCIATGQHVLHVAVQLQKMRSGVKALTGPVHMDLMAHQAMDCMAGFQHRLLAAFGPSSAVQISISTDAFHAVA